MIRMMTLPALGAILILFAAAACDWDVPAMPMVGEEADGGGVSESARVKNADEGPPPEPPGTARRLGEMAASVVPVGLLAVVIIAGALLASYLNKARRGRSG